MDISNILIVSRKYREIREIIENADIQKNFRYLDEMVVKQEDLIWADAFVGFNMTAEVDYGSVKWVHSLGAGVDRFLFKKKWNENVLLTRTICSFGQRIAQYCLSYILQDLQFHGQFKENMEGKIWQLMTPKLLEQQKVMIYGTGEIGQTVAKVLSFFGAEVYGVSLSGRAKDFFKEVLKTESVISHLGRMDTVINTLPLTEKTELLFNKDFFCHVKGAGFINVGRGASVDERALLAALEEYKVRYAVLDVFTEEPLPEEHPFWKHPNVKITPHISAVTTPEEGVECFLETLKNIEENNPLRNKVDIQRKY